MRLGATSSGADVPFVLEAPDTYRAERSYVYRYVLGERLGLAFRLAFGPYAEVRLKDATGRSLRLGDDLFQTPQSAWLTPTSLPARPLARWRPGEAGLSPRSAAPHIPVLFGTGAARDAPDGFTLELDVFGAIFFLITRYEEVADPQHDEHGRFPARSSVSYREGFLERPLADEYVELLWCCIERVWPGLPRRRREARLVLTHDVDRPTMRDLVGLRHYGAGAVRDVASLRWPRALPSLARELAVHARLLRDPLDTFDALMDLSERVGLQSRFFFYAGTRAARLDPSYEISDPLPRRLLERIGRRGHAIGLHVGYDSYRSSAAIAAERARLAAAARPWFGPDPPTWSRSHYLRLTVPDTFAALGQAGITADASLGFADHAGFRAGTCCDFPAFDLRGRADLGLRVHPLVAMDGTLFGSGYMGLEPDEAGERLRTYAALCRRFGGALTLLWHNHVFADPPWREVYERTALEFA